MVISRAVFGVVVLWLLVLLVPASLVWNVTQWNNNRVLQNQIVAQHEADQKALSNALVTREKESVGKLWDQQYANAVVQTLRSLREDPMNPEALRASNTLEQASLRRVGDPENAVILAAHARLTAEAALEIESKR